MLAPHSSLTPARSSSAAHVPTLLGLVWPARTRDLQFLESRVLGCFHHGQSGERALRRSGAGDQVSDPARTLSVQAFSSPVTASPVLVEGAGLSFPLKERPSALLPVLRATLPRGWNECGRGTPCTVPWKHWGIGQSSTRGQVRILGCKQKISS